MMKKRGLVKQFIGIISDEAVERGNEQAITMVEPAVLDGRYESVVEVRPEFIFHMPSWSRWRRQYQMIWMF